MYIYIYIYIYMYMYIYIYIYISIVDRRLLRPRQPSEVALLHDVDPTIFYCC